MPAVPLLQMAWTWVEAVEVEMEETAVEAAVEMMPLAFYQHSTTMVRSPMTITSTIPIWSMPHHHLVG